MHDTHTLIKHMQSAYSGAYEFTSSDFQYMKADAPRIARAMTTEEGLSWQDAQDLWKHARSVARKHDVYFAMPEIIDHAQLTSDMLGRESAYDAHSEPQSFVDRVGSGKTNGRGSWL